MREGAEAHDEEPAEDRAGADPEKGQATLPEVAARAAAAQVALTDPQRRLPARRSDGSLGLAERAQLGHGQHVVRRTPADGYGPR